MNNLLPNNNEADQDVVMSDTSSSSSSILNELLHHIDPEDDVEIDELSEDSHDENGDEKSYCDQCFSLVPVKQLVRVVSNTPRSNLTICSVPCVVTCDWCEKKLHHRNEYRLVPQRHRVRVPACIECLSRFPASKSTPMPLNSKRKRSALVANG